MLELERAGFDIRVDALFASALGEHRVQHGDVAGRLVVSISDADSAASAPAPGEGRVIAEYRPSRSLLAAVERAEARVKARIEREGGLDAVVPKRLQAGLDLDTFVHTRFGGFAALGFLGREIATWPETHSLTRARAMPIRRVMILLAAPG
jgi:hypothetical protein